MNQENKTSVPDIEQYEVDFYPYFASPNDILLDIEGFNKHIRKFIVKWFVRYQKHFNLETNFETGNWINSYGKVVVFTQLIIEHFYGPLFKIYWDQQSEPLIYISINID